MNKKYLAPLLLAALVVVIGGSVLLFMQKGKAADEPMIRIGQIEMREYDVATKVPGRIEWIKVDEGDEVALGQEIFKLTDREIKAKVAQAKGAVVSAQAQLSMLNAGARKQEIDMAKRNFDAAKSQFDLAEKTYNRMKKIHDDKLISDQELDVAYQKFSAASSAMQAAKSQYDMAVEGARSEQKSMAKGQVDRAVQSQEEATAYLDETIVYSPIKGIVVKRLSDVGELAAIGYPVVTIVDPQDVWAELNLPETELKLVKVGDILEGKINGLGVSEKFKIVSFAQMSDFANWRSTSDKATFDVRSFTVKLKPVNTAISSLRPGMTVAFDLKKVSKS